ncbi:MAG: hypothetical protein ICV55_14515 [Coleofasciculus sp. C3-bin4]|nr:hypothetical protein [Coleofasciculus sp. C3-bin4]
MFKAKLTLKLKPEFLLTLFLAPFGHQKDAIRETRSHSVAPPQEFSQKLPELKPAVRT